MNPYTFFEKERYKKFVKRFVDIVGSLGLILLFSPVFIATAVAILIDSSGPVLADVPERIGEQGIDAAVEPARHLQEKLAPSRIPIIQDHGPGVRLAVALVAVDELRRDRGHDVMLEVVEGQAVAVVVAVGRLPVDRWVYYCVDDFSVWPGLDADVMRTMEQELGDGWTRNLHPSEIDHVMQVYDRAFNQRRNNGNKKHLPGRQDHSYFLRGSRGYCQSGRKLRFQNPAER